MGGCLPGAGTSPSGGGAVKGLPGLDPSSSGGMAASGDAVGRAEGGAQDGGEAGGDAVGDPFGGAPSGGVPGTPPGTTSDTPIVVSGLPLGSTPNDKCAPAGTELFFGESDTKTAITPNVDALGRREILIRTTLFSRLGTVVTPVGAKLVYFTDPGAPEKIYGTTASWSGCVFARIYAPAEAAGTAIRLTISQNVCAPLGPEVDLDQADAYGMMARRIGGEPYVQTATLDVPLPAETADSSLADCGAYDWRDQLRDETIKDALIEGRIEKFKP